MDVTCVQHKCEMLVVFCPTDSIYNQILRKEEIDTMDLYVTKGK